MNCPECNRYLKHLDDFERQRHDLQQQLAAATARAERAEAELLVERRQADALRLKLADPDDALMHHGPDAELSAKLWHFELFAAAHEVAESEQPSADSLAKLRMAVAKGGPNYMAEAAKINERAERAEAALAQEHADWAETDTAVRKSLAPLDNSNKFETVSVARLAELAAADCRTLAEHIANTNQAWAVMSNGLPAAMHRWAPKEDTND